MKIMKNDEAVSPVIGVILMVAITVILAAVIAAFVFGLAGSTGTAKNVGLTVTINQTNTDYRVTIQGGTDLNTLDTLKYATGSSNNTPATFASGGNFNVGSSYLLPANPTSTNKLVIIGTFKDGTSQVLFDKQF